MQKTFLLLFISILMYSFFGCANQGVLTGGKKDTQPPVLDSLKSTPNYQTNFKKQTIELKFDEWLQLKDIFNQVVVSPPLQKKFEVSLKKKTVTFEFDKEEVLRENATYTINFGESIQDLTERNPVEDLRFVFSTGDFIDSLEVSGTVVDAFEKKPVKDVLVMLYDNLADTVVRTEKPFYFGRTGEDGTFTIKNVRADTFKVFALLDGNANYLFDNQSEKIGFLNQPITVTDSTKVELDLQLFEEEPPLQLAGEEKKKYGRIALGFNRTPFDGEWSVRPQNSDQKNYVQLQKDSVIVWYDLEEETNWNLLVKTDTFPNDTIKIKKISKADFLKNKKLTLASNSRTPSKIKINPSKPYSIAFQQPLEKVDTALVTLLADTLLQKVNATFEIDSNDRRILLVKYPFKEKLNYQLSFFPNALTDYFGIKNDSIVQNLETQAKSEFGDLTLKVLDLQPGKNYVLELMDKSNKLVDRIPLSGNTDTSFQKIYPALEIGIYSVKVIQDTNANGRLDTGNYDDKLQPEASFSRPLKEILAGWEIESTVSVDEKAATPETETPPSDDEDSNGFQNQKNTTPKKEKNK